VLRERLESTIEREPGLFYPLLVPFNCDQLHTTFNPAQKTLPSNRKKWRLRHPPISFRCSVALRAFCFLPRQCSNRSQPAPRRRRRPLCRTQPRSGRQRFPTRDALRRLPAPRWDPQRCGAPHTAPQRVKAVDRPRR
jgi:hypothetical protein